MQQLATYQRQKANQVNASFYRLSVQLRIHFKILFKVFKAIHNLPPCYRADISHLKVALRSLRSHCQGLLCASPPFLALLCIFQHCASQHFICLTLFHL